MKRTHLQTWLRAGFVPLALTALSGTTHAQIAAFDPEEGLNVVALGLGSAPDYPGSSDNKGALAPTVRYYFSGKRYVQLLGPQLSVNVLNDNVVQFGPQVVARFKRDSEVDDEVVKQMKEIDSAVEGGVFIGAVWQLGDDRRQRIGVRADVQGGDNGTTGTVTFNYFQPVSRSVVLNIGGGIGLADSKWARTYFGVKDADLALFPSQGGVEYKPDGGVMDNRVNFSAIMNLSPNWIVAAGARYQRLHGDFADSPIVKERGDRNQWIYGLVVGYVWQ